MRKSEREVKDAAEKFAALLRCGYMTLAVARGEGALSEWTCKRLVRP